MMGERMAGALGIGGQSFRAAPREVDEVAKVPRVNDTAKQLALQAAKSFLMIPLVIFVGFVIIVIIAVIVGVVVSVTDGVPLEVQLSLLLLP